MKGPERNRRPSVIRPVNDKNAPRVGDEVHYYVNGRLERQTDVLEGDRQWHTRRGGESKVWSSMGILTDRKLAEDSLPVVRTRKPRRIS